MLSISEGHTNASLVFSSCRVNDKLSDGRSLRKINQENRQQQIISRGLAAL